MARVSRFVALQPTFRRNLRKLYRHATDADKREGLAWYPTAVAGAHTWARGFGLDPLTVAAIIAAISPQCDWTTNLRIAFELLAGQPTVSGGALRANVDKARCILADRALSVSGYFKVAPKVTAFARNLGGYAEAVTVDGHAVQAALNDPTYTRGLHVPQYEAVAAAYRAVARELGLRPCDFQAIIWCAWKRRHSSADKRRIIAQRKRGKVG